jgi:PHS family inorganic phosphate transporter-like MFS transporter
MIAGMIVFGFFGDAVGRHKVSGKELIFTLLGTFMIVMTPWNNFSEQSVISWMTVWRVVTGFGVGGGEFFNVKVYGDVVLSPIRLPYVRVDE